MPLSNLEGNGKPNERLVVAYSAVEGSSEMRSILAFVLIGIVAAAAIGTASAQRGQAEDPAADGGKSVVITARDRATGRHRGRPACA